MDKKAKRKFIIIFLVLAAATLIGSILIPGNEQTETIQEAMRDSVLHETNRVSYFGFEVSPAVASGFIVTVALLILALVIRIFVIPRFKTVPGKFQMVLEMLVGYFDGMAKRDSPKKNKFLGAYIFAAGVYIFFGTMSELLGLQLVTIHGASIAMPAPLADINGAISLGFLTYLVIVVGAVTVHGPLGVLKALKEFSLPISMSFRLFGALLSGLLVTDLIYYMHLHYILPVIVGILFTCLHALIQTYVLTMLASHYFGEVCEKKPKQEKTQKIKKTKKKNMRLQAAA